jgi:hypothetical protein
MEDSAALAPELDHARAQNTEAVNTMTITLGEVTFIDQTHAAVLYHLTISGLPTRRPSAPPSSTTAPER